MMLLTTLALVSLRHMPLQLLGSCGDPFPLKSEVSLVLCHDGMSVSGLVQKSSMMFVSRSMALSGRFFSMSVVTPYP